MTAGSVDDAWYHGMESTFGGLQVVPVATSAARATGAYAATDLGGVGIFGISGTPQQLVRSARTLRRSPTESLKVCAVRRGRCLIEQSGREVMVTPGEFGLYDTGLPYRLTWQGKVVFFIELTREHELKQFFKRQSFFGFLDVSR